MAEAAQGGQQQNPFFPPSPEPAGYICEKMAGMNTSPSRLAVADEQVAWMDGFIPLDDQNCRTIPGIGPIIFNSGGPTTIVEFAFGNIGIVPYALLFISDGSIISLNMNTFVPTLIAAPGTITSPTIFSIGTAPYGNQYILIVASQTNGYWIWDGTTLFAPGNVFTPEAPAVVPLGIGGNAIETYQGRVWIATIATISFTSPGSLVDFSSASGGGNFTSADSFLAHTFTQLVSVNGFLYLVADSSVNYISGVQTSGTPPITTFTNQNVDAEIGTPYPNSVITFGRNVMLANSFGVFVIYGSDAKKVSKPLDGVYTSVPVFGGLTISSAEGVIFGRRVWMVLVKIVDPVSNLTRNKILMWDGDKKWWATEQNTDPITYMRHQETNSIIRTFATDGLRLFELFATPSAAFSKTLQSKMWSRPGGFMANKTANMLWTCFDYPLSAPSEVITVEIENEFPAVEQLYVVSPPIVNGFFIPGPIAITQTGKMIGFTLSTMEADIIVNSIQISPQITQYRG